MTEQLQILGLLIAVLATAAATAWVTRESIGLILDHDWSGALMAVGAAMWASLCIWASVALYALAMP
jgi:hypothetical protein